MSTPTLDFTNIQGDILEGLPKRFQSFVFFSIINPTEFRHRLKSIIPFITSTAQVFEDEKAIAAHKASGAKGLLKLVGTNVAFSSKGLIKLGVGDNVGDPIFTKGQLADASTSFNADGIADPGIPSGNGIDPAWDPAFKQEIHGCFLVTGESQLTISARVVEMDAILVGTIKVLLKVDGNVRPGDQAGHEHFGFQDGVSQPPVIGFRQPSTGEIPTLPGRILLGEAGDGDQPTDPPTGPRPAWAKDSSFLVFRKLKQLVPEFNDFLNKNPIPGVLPRSQGSELLGARLVGRWKSGAPVDRDPVHDNLEDAKDVNKVNDFDYSDDPAQIRCPFTAHLRKMNPRASNPPGSTFTQTVRIIRQGIPYGPEVTPTEASSGKTEHDRGLLFVCYQSDLSRGFHFLQKQWGNNPNFPHAGDGFDAIIGQQANDPRSVTGTDPKNLANPLPLPDLFVVPLGGEYFISPSLSALKTTFSS